MHKQSRLTATNMVRTVFLQNQSGINLHYREVDTSGPEVGHSTARHRQVRNSRYCGFTVVRFADLTGKRPYFWEFHRVGQLYFSTFDRSGLANRGSAFKRGEDS
jgi:hypothetical protein